VCMHAVPVDGRYCVIMQLLMKACTLKYIYKFPTMPILLKGGIVLPSSSLEGMERAYTQITLEGMECDSTQLL
jgi:hypothetical protein